MKTILTLLLAGILSIGLFAKNLDDSPLPINVPAEKATVIIKVQTPREFLKSEVEKQGLTDRDYLILSAIIQCESGWSQVWERSYSGHVKGEVKVANGNIGLMQINKGAHHVEYEKLSLDPFVEFDNLKYGIILYKRGGINAWRPWSGHCFVPALAKQGINL